MRLVFVSYHLRLLSYLFKYCLKQSVYSTTPLRLSYIGLVTDYTLLVIYIVECVK